MLRKITLSLLLLFTISTFAQENKIWDLLLNNRRTEARTQFDKQFSAKKQQSFELLLLDALIDEEMGKLDFDETFLQNFLDLKENKDYLFAIGHRKMALGDQQENGVDDLTYRKLDVLAAHPIYANENFVQEYKVLFDKARKNMQGSEKHLAKVNRIPKWQRAGVFENLNGSGLDTEYEPETYAKNDKLFDANSFGKVGWYNPKHQLKDGFELLFNESEYGSAIVYAQSFVENPTERKVYLETSLNAEYKVFVNDTEILSTTKEGYTNPGSHLVEFLLPKGMNRILLKIEVVNGNTSFLAALFDTEHNKLEDVKYFDLYQPYIKSTLQQLSPQELPLKFEKLLLKKIAENPEKVFYKFLLIEGYLGNFQNEQAKELTDELLKLYPNSTLLNFALYKYYKNISDSEGIQKVYKTVQLQDPEYYMTPLLKLQEENWMENATIEDIKKQSNILKKTKAKPYALFLDAIADAKNRDLEQMKTKVREFRNLTHNNETLFGLILQMEYADKVDQSFKIKAYEEMLSKKNNISAALELVNLYSSANDIKAQEKLYREYIELYPMYNEIRTALVLHLSGDINNPELIKQLDESLANFPYSYSLLAHKAEILAKQNKKAEALDFAKQSLSHYSANEIMLKLQRDLNNAEDILAKNAVKDFDKLVKERRNTATKGSNGVTILYDEYVVNVLPEGGYKGRGTYIFEVTSEKGIEELKEYSLSYSFDIIKAEIIKANGDIIPGEKTPGQIVFPNIAVGDVVVVQTDYSESNTGRFYKDFHLVSYFQSYYPSLESVFTLITPENLTYQTKNNNTAISGIKKNLDGKMYQTWRMKNVPELLSDENFAPKFYDEASSVTAGTVKSWKEIADWYADISKKSMVYDKTTEKAFKEIFPNGISGINESQKASKIYEYIQKKINYSSVDFRQSGYIPQKPSKTLVTKLGDCKDLSALFVVLAKQAGLDSNLVLVQTNDNPGNYLSLPNISFNHCIVRLMQDGKPTYIEMTNKNLPFNAIVKSNFHAKALNINNGGNTTQNAEIFEIPSINNVKGISKTITEVDLKNGKSYKTTQYVQGERKSSYNDFFTSEKSDEDKKKSFEESYGSSLNSTIKVNKVSLLNGKDLTNAPLSFDVNYEINDKTQMVGSLKLLKIPFITKPFGRSIIAAENRKRDIIYRDYEDEFEYDEQITFTLPDNEKFVEVPKSENLTYKNLSYSIDYQLEKPNKLVVTRKASTPWENISASDYSNYKVFVEKVVNLEEQVLGYK